MEKTTEIRNVMNFNNYVNKLSEIIIDKDNNYSLADQLYGSMIIATAIDSEFKETDDLTKIYRMLLLSGLSVVESKKNILEDLKLGKQYHDELLCANSTYTKEGFLVNKYKMLDSLLTKIIKDKKYSDNLSEMYKDGSTLIALMCGKLPSECEGIFYYYYQNSKLKDKERSGWNNKHMNVLANRKESVAEHVVCTFGLEMAVSSEFENNIDFKKVQKTIVNHEIGESIIGDITPYDGITPEQKKDMEHRAMIKVLGNLKENTNILNMLFEFDDMKTLESLYAKALDKIQPVLKAKIFYERNQFDLLENLLDTDYFKTEDAIKMIKKGAKNVFEIFYGIEEPRISNIKQFPEFLNIMKVVKVNSLLNSNKVIREDVMLSTKEYSFLSTQLTSVIKKLYADNNIDAAYIVNYQANKPMKGEIGVYFLLGRYVNEDEYEKIVDKLNEEIEKNNKTKVKVFFECSFESKYVVVAMNNSEICRVERLKESTILFDKTGHLTYVYDKCKEHSHLYTWDLVNYIPPIDEALVRNLKK